VITEVVTLAPGKPASERAPRRQRRLWGCGLLLTFGDDDERTIEPRVGFVDEDVLAGIRRGERDRG
jgi:hypothetical protein